MIVNRRVAWVKLIDFFSSLTQDRRRFWINLINDAGFYLDHLVPAYNMCALHAFKIILKLPSSLNFFGFLHIIIASLNIKIPNHTSKVIRHALYVIYLFFIRNKYVYSFMIIIFNSWFYVVRITRICLLLYSKNYIPQIIK